MRFVYPACGYRVVVQVIKLLLHHLVAPQLNRVAALLPKLVFFIVGVMLSGTFKVPKHPFLAAFLRMVGNSVKKCLGGMPFQVAHNFGQGFVSGADNEMYMVAHN